MSKYHKYVFDQDERKLVGAFEEMYSAEDTEGFDSWQSNDVRHLRLRVSMEVLRDYNFDSVLELGCGKGVASQFLKKANNRVLGVDVSPTAVKKASVSFPDIEFRVMDVMNVDKLDEKFELTTLMAVMAYVEKWPLLLKKISKMSEYLLIAEFIPSNPIGMVKSASELEVEIEHYFEIQTKVALNDSYHIVFAKNKRNDLRKL